MYILNRNKNKGFTIVELIIVMAILALLVLVAVPKFLGHTKQANLTKIKSSAKEIEDASDRYYLKNDDWPRATSKDDYYTKEELESYAKEIYDKTGTVINLDLNGHYYDINYTALKSYVRVPDESVKYIIQNPIGRVYYLDKLTPAGEEIFNNNVIQTPEPTPLPEPGPNPDIEDEISDEGYFIIDSTGNVSASATLKALPGPLNISIPSAINGIEAKAIKTSGFASLNNINSVKLPNTITSIGSGAFNSSSITSIELNNGLLTIGDTAFLKTKIVNLNLPDSVTSLGIASFSGITTLETIKLSNNLKTIGYNCFYSATKVSSIEIPKSVTNIGYSAFNNATENTTILIKSRDNANISVGTTWSGNAKVIFEEIDDYFISDSDGAVYASNAFQYVEGPINLTIPESINSITITSIKTSGFASLKNINSIKLSNTIKSIGSGAFNSSSITSIELNNGLLTIGDTAFLKTKIVNLNLPDSITSLGIASFSGVTTLETIKLSNNLKTIGYNCFYSATKVSSIEIPKSVTNIGYSAFNSFTSSQTIKFIGRSNTAGVSLGTNWAGAAKIVHDTISE